MPCSKPCRNSKKVLYFFPKHEMVDLITPDTWPYWCPDTELMLLGFISLMLTVSQAAIRHICVPPALVNNMFPCKKPLEEHHAPKSSHSIINNARHLLSTGESPDHCAAKAIILCCFASFLSLTGSLSINHWSLGMAAGAGSISICGSVASTPYLHLCASGFSRHLLRLNHGSWRSKSNTTCFYSFLLKLPNNIKPLYFKSWLWLILLMWNNM